jgi:oligo-1,6-glucosidase
MWWVYQHGEAPERNNDVHPGSVARRDWWKSAVVYQVYPRSFADSDGDGVGDLGGILDHLDYLELLGVDVVWLSPVYRSPMADNGYDISDYHDVDPLFGTLQQLDELIAQLHARDMKLVMDLVVNHTSSAHAWFAESRSSTDNPKRDWYWWRSPRPGPEPGSPGSEPTNWGSAFSGSAWTYDNHSGEFYLHLFAPDQPDLNWENPEVRQAIYAMMRYWLDRGVDGFRMDVINVISKVVGPVGDDGRVTLPDGMVGGERNPRWPGVVDTDSFADTPAFVLNGPRIHEFLQEMHREVFAGRPPGLLNVGETPGCPVEEAVLYTDPSRGELDMVFQFEHVDLDSGPNGKWDVLPMTMLKLKQSLGRWQDGLAEIGWNSLYLGNHDQPRCVSRFGSDAPEHREQSAKALATVLHMHRGTPYVYQGDELGMSNAGFTRLDQLRDVESLNHYYAAAVARGEDPADVMRALAYKGRDNARVPMSWDASPGAGFTTGTPWLDLHPLSGVVNAAAQVDDPNSVFSHYRRLIALRHAVPCVAHGTFRMLLADHEQLYCFERSFGDTRLLVVANLSSAADVIPDLSELPAWSSAEPLLASIPGSSPVPTDPLAAWESRVFRLA